MSALWTSREVAESIGVETSGAWQAIGVSIDSRTISKGDLFVALEGPNNDGHDYVADALAKGAVAAVVHRAPPCHPHGRILQVADTFEALRALGIMGRRRARRTRVVGVTGSMGKTGTKTMIAAALACSGSVSSSVNSYNNEIGVPLTLARLPREVDFAVIELGARRPGDIRVLAAQARPQVGVVTVIGPAHIETFGSLENVASTKSEIFYGLGAEGCAILPSEGTGCDVLERRVRDAGAVRVLRFGSSQDADARVLRAKAGPEGTSVHAIVLGQEVFYRLGAASDHLVGNSLAALLAVEAVGGNLARACCALAQWSSPEGRGTREFIPLPQGQGFLLLDDSYNANPSSMRAALEGLAAQPASVRGTGGRRLAFLGDMLELGDDEVAYHESLADLEAVRSVDRVYLCGSRMRHLHEALPVERRGGWMESPCDLARVAARVVRPGDVAMVKGSNAAGVARVAEALRAIGAEAV